MMTGLLFSEAEVITFLRQMLPVLGHIHNFGIIHRDISPDNIIRRERDLLPVLIDFGVVKELATKVQSPDLGVPMTNVGKFGYAPWEQIQIGKATANSDLYALAVTAIVIFTGKEPQELIDQTTLTWNWQRSVAVSPGFAEVINKMLSRQPGDRYQSVTEVEQALTTLANIKYQQVPTIKQQSNKSSPSEAATVGVTPESNSNQNPDDNGNFFDNHRWVATALVALLVALSGLASWSAVNFVLKRRQQKAELQQPTQINPIPVPTLPTITPTSTPSSISSPTPTTTSTPSPVIPTPPSIPEITFTPLPERSPLPEEAGTTPPPVITSEERLNISPGEPISIEGNLQENETINYIISGSQGQNLNLLVTGEGVLMSLLGEDGEPVDRISEKVSIWKGVLPTDGNYEISLTPLPGLPGTDYKLDINLINPAPAPLPETEVNESPTPTPETETTDSPPVSPLTEPEVTESPSPTPEATESPQAIPLNKPFKKQIKKPSPISTPVETETPFDKLNKPPKKESLTLPEKIEKSPKPQVLTE